MQDNAGPIKAWQWMLIVLFGVVAAVAIISQTR